MRIKLATFFFILGTLLLCFNFQRVFGLAISDWLYITSFFFYFIDSVSHNNFKEITSNKNIFSAMLILIGSLLSMFRAQYYLIATIELFQQLFVIIIFVSLIWFLINKGKIYIIIKTFCYSGFITATIASLDFIFGTNLGPTLSKTQNMVLWERYAGTLGHPNKLGGFLVSSSLFSFDLLVNSFLYKKKKEKIIYFIIFIIQIFGIYLSGSMSALIGLIIGLAVYFMFNPILRKFIYKNFIIKLSFISFIISISLFLLINFSNIDIFVSKFLDTNISKAYFRIIDETARSRIDIYEISIKEALKNPIFGVGLDQLSTSSIPFIDRKINGTVHNVFLQIFYTGGVFSLFGWIIIYFNLIKNGIKEIFKNQLFDKNHCGWILLATSISLIIMDQFQDVIYQREKWLIFGLFFSFTWSLKKQDFIHDSLRIDK